jgi:hypothetical protein
MIHAKRLYSDLLSHNLLGGGTKIKHKNEMHRYTKKIAVFQA